MALEITNSETLKKEIEENHKINVYDIITIEEEKKTDIVAINLSEVKYFIPKQLSAELKRLYSTKIAKGYEMLNDNELMNSLKRQNILNEEIPQIFVNQKGYLLLRKKSIILNRPMNQSPLSIESKKPQKKKEIEEERTRQKSLSNL